MNFRCKLIKEYQFECQYYFLKKERKINRKLIDYR